MLQQILRELLMGWPAHGLAFGNRCKTWHETAEQQCKRQARVPPTVVTVGRLRFMFFWFHVFISSPYEPHTAEAMTVITCRRDAGETKWRSPTTKLANAAMTPVLSRLFALMEQPPAEFLKAGLRPNAVPPMWLIFKGLSQASLFGKRTVCPPRSARICTSRVLS